MKGIAFRPTVCSGIRQRSDDLNELDDRPGPAVCHDQGEGALHGRADVQEVDSKPVDVGPELREEIEPRFPLPPVVRVCPVAAEVL